MRVHGPASVPGQKGVLAVLEIELTTKARRVRVDARDGLEPLDLKAETVGGTYDVPDAIQRLTVPMRVTRDGAGRSHVKVTVTDAKGATPPETWEGDVALETPVAVAEGRSRAGLVGAFVMIVAAIVVFVVLPMLQTPSVPRLLGKTQANAERDLRALGYAPLTRWVETTDAAKDGTVVGQSPDPDQKLARRQQVEITVARLGAPTSPSAPAGPVAPDFVGKTTAEASAALATLGVTTTVTEEDAPEERVGRVLSQKPAPGQPLPSGSTVELVIGRKAGSPSGAPGAGNEAGTSPPGPTPTPPPTPTPAESDVDVPAVVTRLRADAEKAIRDVGLVPEVTVGPGPAPAGLEDAVTEQKPAGGRLAKGSTVHLVVGAPAAAAPTPTPIPSEP